MNIELHRLFEWVNVNKQSLNISKTNYMIFAIKGKSVDTNL